MMKESSKWIAAFVEIIIENGDWTETSDCQTSWL